jgi:hypothetical protein
VSLPIRVDEPKGSAAWWMQVLTQEQDRKLRDQHLSAGVVRPGLLTLKAWLDNNPPLPEGAPAWASTYQAFHASTRTNYSFLAVSSAADPLTPVGFRTGAANDDNGDVRAEEIWLANEMPVQQVDLIHNMFGLRDGYLMVGRPDDDEPDIPIVTSEDPMQICTAHDPLRRSRIIAAIKTYFDPYENEDVCVVYIRGGRGFGPRATAHEARKAASSSLLWRNRFRYARNTWAWKPVVELATVDVPLVRFENRRGMAEYEPHLGLLDRMNRITLQRMLIGELQAFRQRAVEGLPDVWPNEPGVPPELVGTKIDYDGVFTPGPGSLWKVPPGAKFWESQPIDLRPILDEEKMEERKYAALVGIPIAYFAPDDANGSASGADLQQKNYTSRVEDRRTIVDAGLCRAQSLIFQTLGDQDRARISQIETIWAPDRMAMSEKYSAASQASNVLDKITIRREVLQFTPRQMRAAAADDDAARLQQLSDQRRLMQMQAVAQPQRVDSQRADQPTPGQRAVPAGPSQG